MVSAHLQPYPSNKHARWLPTLPFHSLRDVLNVLLTAFVQDNDMMPQTVFHDTAVQEVHADNTA